jgi:PST family polysaccharide transporter
MWSLLETFGATGFSLLAVIVLARVLSVEEMGTGALAVSIVHLTSLPFDLLFRDTLVQRERLDEVHVSSAFTVTAVGSLMAAAAMFAFAPSIAAVYGQPQLAILLEVAALAIPLASVSSVVSATLRRRLAFAPLARRTIVGRLIGVAAGVVTAFMGWGALSMVVMHTGSIGIATLVLLSDRASLPRLRFSWQATREMLAFALPNMAAQLLLVGNSRLFLGVLGLFTDTATFGRFSLAFRLVEETRNILSAAASELALPLFARKTHDTSAFSSVYRESTSYTATLLLPLYAGLALLAPDLVSLLFGAKWEGTETIIQLLCVATMVVILREYSGIALHALGFPGTNLRINAVGVLVSIVPFILGQVSTGMAAALVWAARALGLLIASFFGLRSRTSLSLVQQLKPAAPALLGIAAMTAVLLLALMPVLNDFGALARVAILVPVGATVYLATVALVSPPLLPRIVQFVAGAARGK